jgi:hypothetical protein
MIADDKGHRGLESIGVTREQPQRTGATPPS